MAVLRRVACAGVGTGCSSFSKFVAYLRKALTSIHFAFELGSLERILNVKLYVFIAENQQMNVYEPSTESRLVFT